MKKRKICLDDFKHARKSRDKNSPINFFFGSVVSPYASYVANKLFPFLTPNMLSFLWLMLGIAAIFIMGLGGYKNLVIGILLYHLFNVIDYMDGNLARVKGIYSLRGTYLDRIGHHIHRSLLLLAIGINLFISNQKIIWLYLGVWCSMLIVFNHSIKVRIYEIYANHGRFDLLKEKQQLNKSKKQQFRGNLKQKIKSYALEMLRPNNPFTLLFFSIILGVSSYYLIFMSLVLPVLFIKEFIDSYFNIEKRFKK